MPLCLFLDTEDACSDTAMGGPAGLGRHSLAVFASALRIQRARGHTLGPKEPQDSARPSQSCAETDRRWLNLPSLYPGHGRASSLAASETFLRNLQSRLEIDVKKVCFASATIYIYAYI